MPKYFNPVGYTGRKANQNKSGQSRFSTSAEAILGEKKDVVISPSTLSSAVESLLPADVTFTSVTTDQVIVDGGAATDFIGQAILVSGTVTVANTNIAATDRIFLSRTATNSSTALGELAVPTITAGASFVITAKDLTTPANTVTGDLSTVSYFIVRQS